MDSEVAKVYAKTVEKQKRFSHYAETFSKVRNLSQQLSRCNALLNQNIEMMETLNNMLPVEDRLEPFVWTTNK
jgi:BLOC-1 related complex subunit 5